MKKTAPRAARKKAAPATKKKTSAAARPARRPPPRADLGAPIVNLILPGLPGTYADPDRRLEGEGKTGQHLKLRAPDDLPRQAVRGWLRTAAARARQSK